MNKVVRNGRVAVIHSCDWGAGWYSWHGVEELLYLPQLVESLERPWSDTYETRTRPMLEKVLTEHNLQTNLIPDLAITWVPVGSRFFVLEYDGVETVIREDEMKWITA